MKDNEIVIGYPNLGDYSYVINFLLTNLTKKKVIDPPKTTKRSIELGNKYSPNEICLPFKYNLGNYIEVLEMGANTLFQFGGGCKYGFYGEVLMQILSDLGYDFTFEQLIIKGKLDIGRIYAVFKYINRDLKFRSFIYYFLLSFYITNTIDKNDIFIRKNIGFEVCENSFLNLKKEMLLQIKDIKSFKDAYKFSKTYRKELKKLKINKPKSPLKIGIIGELFTNMEENANYFLEKELAKMGIEITRFTDVSYLLVFKWLKRPFTKFMARKYLKYTLGADATENIERTLYLARKHYDGIIHIKPFGCTPEISAIPIINKICQDKDIPIIYFSYDTLNSETGIKTRLEAFYDLLSIKKEKMYE